MEINLSKEQEYAYDKFIKGENIIICGSGGTGKSELIKIFTKYLVKNNKKFQITSTTGCSCVLLSQNIIDTNTNINTKNNISIKTIHSWSGIKLCNGINKDIIERITNNKYYTQLWKSTNILIIDEISMMSNKIFTILEQIGRIMHNKHKPFGGMQIILLGDFLQLSPIPIKNDISSGMFAFESVEWNNVFSIENHIELKTIFRQKNEIFKNILNEIRIGQLSDESNDILQSRVGIEYDYIKHHGISPLYIMSTRKEVQRKNEEEYMKITDSKEYIFEINYNTSCNTYISNGKILSIEDKRKCSYLNENQIEIEKNNMLQLLRIDNTIKLKIGASVMILINYDMNNSICNGSSGIIIDIININIVVVKFYNGIIINVMKHVWQNSDYPCITLSQIPLTLAYATTIHKQQGASINVAKMNLGQSIFTDSQIYVALSRIISLDGLYLDAFDPSKITVNNTVINFYKKFIIIHNNGENEKKRKYENIFCNYEYKMK